jgi:predicted dehydrogenase
MMPTKIRAFCHFGKWHNVEIEDDVTCYCEYPNGATGVFITTSADAPGTNRFEVTGTKGTLIFENDKLLFKELKVDERVHCYEAKTGFKIPEVLDTVEVELVGENSQHAGILSNVANAILGIEEIYAPASDGICGVELANAMLLSTWLDKTVTLPIDGKEFYKLLQEKIKESKPKEKADNNVIFVQ